MGYNGEQNQTQNNLCGTYRWAKQITPKRNFSYPKFRGNAAMRADRGLGVLRRKQEGERDSTQESLVAEKSASRRSPKPECRKREGKQNVRHG